MFGSSIYKAPWEVGRDCVCANREATRRQRSLARGVQSDIPDRRPVVENLTVVLGPQIEGKIEMLNVTGLK